MAAATAVGCGLGWCLKPAAARHASPAKHNPVFFKPKCGRSSVAAICGDGRRRARVHLPAYSATQRSRTLLKASNSPERGETNSRGSDFRAAAPDHADGATSAARTGELELPAPPTANSAEPSATPGSASPTASASGSVLGSVYDSEPSVRRTVQVTFTCDACGARTSRLANPLALKKGTVFVQCGGCEKFHRLVDNLGLIVEYDFRNEGASESGSERG